MLVKKMKLVTLNAFNQAKGITLARYATDQERDWAYDIMRYCKQRIKRQKTSHS
jgi:hypothetical protein